MFNKKIISLPLIITLCACATEAKYTQKLNQEIGKTQTQIINTWGEPTQIKEMPNGKTILTYISKTNEMVPYPNSYFAFQTMDEDEMFSQFTYGGDVIPDGNFLSEDITDYCKTVFYLQNNRVISYQYTGNACVAI